MKWIVMKALLLICLLIGLTGCWNSRELTDFGFIMGVSLDQTEEGSIEINAQVYSPLETIGGTGSSDKPAYTNVKTVSKSVFDGIRDLTKYLGRKAQWSHMRVILIEEQFAKEHDIGEILDFFYRDHEVRLTSLVIITEGKAADYWKYEPFIERTMSQQLRTMIESAFNASGKTISALLLDIAMQLNSKVKATLIPYIKTTDEQPTMTYSSGTAVISQGKMVDYLTPSDVQSVLMLTDKFKGGTIEFSCMDKEIEKKESLETLSVQTKVSPKFTDNPPTIKMLTKIEGMAGELSCTSITTKEDLKQLEKHIEQQVKEKLEEVIKRLQEKKVDIIGIGNKLYQQDPALWKNWEKDWDNIFANIQFGIDVEVTVKGTGMLLGEKVTEE
ncbi:Ger(x)C family spore germination protein [Bacillus taeanensis]|uniref:Ger(X)C family spore germination protein n=1 Tax=Bacillus taeanensis TaxID=273032 RepID=A0A366XQE6_9BACI|nr:Ger(x)C family spore germination protein [Bacillus taeanensis]RBW67936.1 Ger(x)C family spore germination protein [Bacillus taeanensis]